MATKSTSPSSHHVHFIGIGGIGMSALTRWFLSQGWTVSGSDLTDSPLLDELKGEGVAIFIGPHIATSLLPQTELVIRTQAVSKDNPEYEAALARHLQIYTYPEMLGILSRERTTIAISGAHGKSTTTALVGLILIEAGKDPTIFVGTKLKELSGKNFRLGHSEYLVLEADEYGKAFHQYSPEMIVVTNIDAEHLDTYGHLAGVKEAFLTYFTNIHDGGTLILNRDDKNLFSLHDKVERIAVVKGLHVVWFSVDEDPDLVTEIESVIQIPGRHNVSNALAAIHISEALGIPRSAALTAIGTYNGSWRRMEYRGEITFDGVTPPVPVYDDYAHHPTEIRATLQGLREKYSNHATVCVFQPHQAKRLTSLFKEFTGAFEDADITLIMPLYRVPGRDEVVDEKHDAEALVQAIQKEYPDKPVFYLANPDHLKSALTTLLTSPIECGPNATHEKLAKPAVLVMMGAGNVVEYTNRLI